MPCRRCGYRVERRATQRWFRSERTLNLCQLKSASETVEEFLTERRGRFAEAIFSGDAAAAMQIVDEILVARQALSDIYVSVIAPSLVALGDSWCRGETSTGEEKLATQIVVDQMERLRALFVPQGARSPYRVMVACVEGEHHFIGARMTADLCAGQGWNVDFLGHNVPRPVAHRNGSAAPAPGVGAVGHHGIWP